MEVFLLIFLVFFQACLVAILLLQHMFFSYVSAAVYSSNT